jgi:hypothetical protein
MSFRSIALLLSVTVGIAACSHDGQDEAGETTQPRITSEPTNAERDAAEPDLRRPLRLPQLGSEEPCPRTPGGRPNPDIGIALGSGPVYPVLGFSAPPPAAKGVALLDDYDLRRGAYWHKTLWAVDPRYDGPVLIRGRRIDALQELGFGYDNRQLEELELPAQESDSWRYGPSETIVPGPGCYAFQVDGATFSEVIVFRAAHPLEGKPQGRSLRLPEGRASRRFTITAFDPPTHTYDVRVVTRASADLGVQMRTWYGQPLQVLDSIRGDSICHIRLGRADCFLAFPALEAQRAGEWTVIVRKRSGPAVAVRVEVTFNPL